VTGPRYALHCFITHVETRSAPVCKVGLSHRKQDGAARAEFQEGARGRGGRVKKIEDQIEDRAEYRPLRKAVRSCAPGPPTARSAQRAEQMLKLLRRVDDMLRVPHGRRQISAAIAIRRGHRGHAGRKTGLNVAQVVADIDNLFRR